VSLSFLKSHACIFVFCVPFAGAQMAGVLTQLERAGPVARARRTDGVRGRASALGALVAKEQGTMDVALAVLRRG
jgi:hypothetical protein